ncbi:probable V-type proton ATPase subunit F [Hydra vulgaris]|uniref:V-type proton ATPase subunit F n=1 Tax=Hydra vulgaris TaxID=6087 RepID=T2MCN6_HYDVU|nr:probable V-type proton ATPase subunit F [Hydra vulgaris]
MAVAKGKIIAVIADRDTCTGFLLGGIGEINAKRQKNFLVVGKETTVQEIQDAFVKFTTRADVAIILITQKVAEEIRHLIDSHVQPIPAVLEIPSKDCPYDSSKDSILKRAKGMFSSEDFR